MKTQRYVSTGLFLVSVASVIGAQERPTLAAPRQTVGARQAPITQPASFDYVYARISMTGRLAQALLLPPEQRLNRFRSIGTTDSKSSNSIWNDWIELDFDPRIQDDAYIASVFRYKSIHTSYLVARLISDGSLEKGESRVILRDKATIVGQNLFGGICLLVLSEDIVKDFNASFPDVVHQSAATEQSSGQIYAWVQHWIAQPDNKTKFTEASKKANTLLFDLQPLDIEQRAQRLRAFTSEISPEAGREYERYYDAKKVKSFAVNGPTKVKAPEPPSLLPSQDEIDRAVEKLTPRFRGNDIYAMADRSVLNKIDPKGDFEKTDAYIYRVNSAIAQAIGMKNTWTKDSVFAALIKLEKVNKEYDADKEVLTVWPHITDEGGMLFAEKSVPVTKEMRASSMTYTREVSFSMNNWQQFPYRTYEGHGYFTGGWGLESIKIKMSPDVAKKLVPQLQVLVLFQVAGRDRKHDFSALIKEIWVFDSSTGEIYKKLVAQ